MEDTESIIGKAIRDGGIDAVLDHEQGWMRSRQVADVYATAEPQSAFHARIAFCLDLHNEVRRCCDSFSQLAALLERLHQHTWLQQVSFRLIMGTLIYASIDKGHLPYPFS